MIRHNGSFVKTHGFCTDVLFTAALAWIKQVKDGDKPFFAYIPTNAPHMPFIAPPKNTKRFTALGFSPQTAGFYGMIENIDENLGRMLGKLGEWNLYQNTVIIFMSDNGMSPRGAGRLGEPIGTAADGTKLFPYNAGMKGPANEERHADAAFVGAVLRPARRASAGCRCGRRYGRRRGRARCGRPMLALSSPISNDPALGSPCH